MNDFAKLAEITAATSTTAALVWLAYQENPKCRRDVVAASLCISVAAVARARRKLAAAGLMDLRAGSSVATSVTTSVASDTQNTASVGTSVTSETCGVEPPVSVASDTYGGAGGLISCNTPRPLKGAYPPPGGTPSPPSAESAPSGDSLPETPANRLRRRYLDAFEALTGLPGHTATAKARSAVREFDTTVAKLMSAGVTEDELAAAIDLFCADDRSRDESLPFRWLVNDLGSKWLARVRNPRSNANQPDDGFTTEWGRQAGVADLIIPSAGELPF